MMFFCSPVALPAGSEVQQLAAEAKQRFSRVMQPPIFENPLIAHALFLEGTDTGLLSQTLTARWQQTNSTSPNVQGTGKISVLHVSWWDETATDTLLEIADERLCNANEAL